MNLTRFWSRIRTLVPLGAYPLLAPLYRLRRRRHLARLERHDRAFGAAHPGVSFPPADMRYKVAGPCTVDLFWHSGELILADIARAMATVGATLAGPQSFLDFGCGCGRLAHAVAASMPDLRYAGCDIDRRAIGWCRDNLPGQSFVANGEHPPCPFPDGTFDVVWCGSVFTHIDEARQDEWLSELKRILKPGGLLLASVHGRDSWAGRLPAWVIRDLERTGFLFADTGADAGIHPDWYRVAWHSEAYIRRHWARFFDVAQYLAKGLNNHQDIVVCQKTGGP
ncbi:MAG: methyltransferase domain-containing protein [Rhodospirillaceae bacterium]|nr:methyltransferase domain-containing protein [Rhodospirillaceae bacterium]